jgi:hypothetical protein
MTTETPYNGWSNRETWLVNLWLTNDEGTYNEVRGMSADHISDYVELLIDDVCANPTVPGFANDLIGTALIHVNWFEIANSLSAE